MTVLSSLSFKPYRANVDKVLLQMHLCIQYSRHTYSVTRSLETVKKAFQEELRKWGTDYADIGLIHMIDSDSTYRRVVDAGIMDYAIRLFIPCPCRFPQNNQ